MLEDVLVVSKFISFIKWAIAITIIILFLVFVFTPGLVKMLKPTFFPNLDISGFENSITIVSYIITFLSAGLACISIYQAKSSTSQTNTIIKSLTEIKERQGNMNFLLKQSQQQYGEATSVKKELDEWNDDDYNE